MNMGIAVGLIKALAPGVDPGIIEQAVMDWLDDHPEATTTVQDGSITEAKLAQDVLADLAEIPELKEAIVPLTPSATSGDVGKFMKVKSVSGGKVAEYEFGEASGGGADIDDTAGIGDTDKAWSADNLGKKFNPVTSTFSEGTENGYYRVTQNGEIEEVSGAFKRSKVEIQPWMGKYVEFSVNGLVGNAYAIYCGFSDANDEYISKNAYVVGSQKLEIPSNAKYIYMSFFGSSYNSDYVVKPNKVIFTNDLKELGVENPFIGKQGVAFGTSLTYRAISDYGYLDFLPGLSGATIDNQGISSAMIGTNILPAVKAYTGYASKDFVIVEGFVNDWAHNVGIGDWNDSTEQTVCGCVRSIINYILSQNNKLTIFFVLDHYGKLYAGMDCSSTAQNTNNLTQYEYYEKIAKTCESLGIPVIKQYAESQICENTPDYLYDQIHPSEVGAKQSANVIWQAMKRYGLRVN